MHCLWYVHKSPTCTYPKKLFLIKALVQGWYMYMQFMYVWHSNYKHKHFTCVPLRSCSTQHSTTYIKKLIEDNCSAEETVRLLGVSQQRLPSHMLCLPACLLVCLQYCCWENWPFSMIVINEILSEVYRQFVLQLTEQTPIFYYCSLN